MKIFKSSNKIEERLNKIEKFNISIFQTLEQNNERIKTLEKIIQNQPLIKKYQKTLDIFLKNAQD